MNIIFAHSREYTLNLQPFTFTRPACDIRCGILTIREKWEKMLNVASSTIAENHLQEKFPLHVSSENIIVNGNIIPTNELIAAVQKLNVGEKIVSTIGWIAIKTDGNVEGYETKEYHTLDYSGEIDILKNTWEIFSKAGKWIEEDFKLLTTGKKSQLISTTNTIIGDASKIFLEEGAIMEASILNTNTGVIYIGKDAEVMEGCVIRGPFALGEHSQLKLAAKIYGPSSFGPHCKVGGEVNNSILFGYSSKAHDGFLGNSVLGEWCNLGADTNNSNLKNNYAEVKLWHFGKKSFVKTGLQFCGLMMGDHSKCGINTMFNTGTVVGVSANIFGDGFPRNYIPSFSWGGAAGFTTYKLQDAITTAELVYKRRNMSFDDVEKRIFEFISQSNDEI